MRVGRPRYEITDAICHEAEELASQGLTKVQIAASLGIHYCTLNEKTKDFPEFSEAIKRGQAKGVLKVSSALFDAALKGSVTAQIFYLKRRAPDSWGDNSKPEGEAFIESNMIDHQQHVRLAKELMEFLGEDNCV